MKISVILPVYNVEKDLDRCMECLQRQTLPKEDYQIILVDDGSTDSSGEICDSYAKGQPRVKCIHQENAGASAARNTGLAAAEGEWLAFVDPDDVISERYLEAAVTAGESEAADVVIFDGVRVDVRSGRREPFALGSADRLITDPDEILGLRCRTLYEKTPPGRHTYPMAAPWNKIYRRSFLEENGLSFPGDLKVLDDMFFTFMMFGRAKRIAYVHEQLYEYMYQSGTVSTKYRADRSSLDRQVFEKLTGVIGSSADQPGSEELSVYARRRLYRAYCARVVKSFAICCTSSYFHDDDPSSPAEQLDRIREDLEQYIYARAFDDVRTSDLEPKLIPVTAAVRSGRIFALRLMARLQKKL